MRFGSLFCQVDAGLHVRQAVKQFPVLAFRGVQLSLCLLLLKTCPVGTTVKFIAFPASLIEGIEGAIQRVGTHSSALVEFAIWTLNVNDGVVPPIVHEARRNG